MKICLTTILLCSIVILSSCVNKTKDTSETNNNDWENLFNGENLDGWIPKFNHHKVGDNYANTFRVKDGVIQANYDQYKEFGSRFGHLFYHKPFSSFHLKFEYRFLDQWMDEAPKGTYRNSGVMFHSQDPHSILKEQKWPISVEYQILARQNDSISRTTGNVCSPGTDVYINGEKALKHWNPSSSKTYDWDKWVSGELIVYADSLIIHLVEGDTVLQYTKPQMGGKLIEGADPSFQIEGKALTSGFIGLQAEGQGLEFREIKIKRLE